ncbi:MAG: cytochrome P450 [Acidimicrobiales bacterium]
MTDLATQLAEAGMTSPMLAESRPDPYPAYAFIREREPVHRAPDGTWVLTRHDHASAVLRDPRFSTSPIWLADADPRRDSIVRQAGSSLMMFLDPPDHTRLRGLVSQAFTPRMVDSLRPRVAQIVDGLIDAVIDQGHFDVLADLAYPLPTIVICELLGVPASDREQFKGWAADSSRLLDGYLDREAQNKGLVAGMHLFGYFNDLVAERSTSPRDDLLSALIAVADAGQLPTGAGSSGPSGSSGGAHTDRSTPPSGPAGTNGADRLSRAELLTTITLLFVAGFETTMNMVGNGMLALLRHPDQLARLQADPGLLRTGVEELARYDSPVHVTARIATTEVEVGGQRIGAGQQLAVVLGAANRDPDAFANPDHLDVTRSPNRHLAFGGGPHFCLGAALARIEAQEAFAAILGRLRNLELITTRPVWRDHFVIRGVKALEVAFSPVPRQA